MTHILTRRAPVAALGFIAVMAVATPALAQGGRVSPPSRAGTPDSAIAPPRERRVPPAAAITRVPASQQAPTLVEPVRQLERTPAPVVPAALAATLDSAVVPAPIQRQAPPAPRASASPVAELRTIGASNAAPSGATGRCKDGTYLTSAASESACSSRGGLAVAFPAARTTPAAAVRQ